MNITKKTYTVTIGLVETDADLFDRMPTWIRQTLDQGAIHCYEAYETTTTKPHASSVRAEHIRQLSGFCNYYRISEASTGDTLGIVLGSIKDNAYCYSCHTPKMTAGLPFNLSWIQAVLALTSGH